MAVVLETQFLAAPAQCLACWVSLEEAGTTIVEGDMNLYEQRQVSETL
jgi:hypothetical protein